MRSILCLLILWMGVEHLSIPAILQAARPPAGVKLISDLVYKEVEGRALHLDLYVPEQATEALPVVVWVHGGGWVKGSKDGCPARWLATNGFAVVSVQYRLATEAQWPSQIEDCRDAVRWVRRHAREYGFREDRIGAWGSSAGGHLVALMGTLELPEKEEVSGAVQAVCDWFGPSDLLTMPANTPGSNRTEEALANSNGAKLLGATVYKVPELARQASAFHQASAGDSPFLILHGDADPMVPLEQSTRLHEALQKAGVPSRYIVVREGAHGGPKFNTPEVQKEIVTFFTARLK